MSKKLVVLSMFGIPPGVEINIDFLRELMLESVKKFHGMVQHIPTMPDEFALVLTMATKDNPVDPVFAAVIQTTSEMIFIQPINAEKKVYDLGVARFLKQSEFQVETVYSKELKLLVPKFITFEQE